MILGPRHVEILLACRQYGLLTAPDFQHLLKLRSRSHVRTLLRELCAGEGDAERGYLFRVPLPHARPGGTEHVYFLARRARAYLARQEGLRVEWFWIPGKARQVSVGRLMHNLTLARFLIALRVFCDTRTDIRLAEVRTQYEIARDPLLAEAAKHSTAEETPPRVVPDAWVNVELWNYGPPPRVSPLLVEIDRGTEYSRAFQERLRARLAFIRPQGLYRRMFATDRVRILYLTTAGSTRVDCLARWTMETLTAEDREDWATVFLFAETSFETLYEKTHSLFSEAAWKQPGQLKAVRLFE
jgi:hypothetical protein